MKPFKRSRTNRPFDTDLEALDASDASHSAAPLSDEVGPEAPDDEATPGPRNDEAGPDETCFDDEATPAHGPGTDDEATPAHGLGPDGASDIVEVVDESENNGTDEHVEGEDSLQNVIEVKKGELSTLAIIFTGYLVKIPDNVYSRELRTKVEEVLVEVKLLESWYENWKNNDPEQTPPTSASAIMAKWTEIKDIVEIASS